MNEYTQLTSGSAAKRYLGLEIQTRLYLLHVLGAEASRLHSVLPETLHTRTCMADSKSFVLVRLHHKNALTKQHPDEADPPIRDMDTDVHMCVLEK